MKIGVFTDSYLPQPDGVATSVASSSRQLERNGHKTYIVAPKQPGCTERKNVYRLTSFKFNDTPEFRLALYLPETPLLRTLRIDFDIIHGHSGGPITILGREIARRKHVPFIYTYHTMWSHYTHYLMNGWVITPKIATVISRIFCNMCDYVVVPSNRVKEELISYGVTKKIVTIPNGIDIKKFKTHKKNFLRDKLNLPDDAEILLHVGRIAKEKSVTFLVEALPTVLKTHPHAHLVFIGDGPDRTEIEQRADALNVSSHIHILGAVEHREMPKVYHDANIFVFASKSETQGMVLLEALASKLPIVAVNDKTFADVLRNGENAILTERNTQKFAHDVVRLLDNTLLQKELVKNGSVTVEKFSTEATTRLLEDLYKTALASYKKEHQEKLVYPIYNIRAAKKVINEMNDRLQKDLKELLGIRTIQDEKKALKSVEKL